jgi:hypothetical protein
VLPGAAAFPEGPHLERRGAAAPAGTWRRASRYVTNLGGNYPWAALHAPQGIHYAGYTLLETDTKGDVVEFLRDRRAAWEKLAL